MSTAYPYPRRSLRSGIPLSDAALARREHRAFWSIASTCAVLLFALLGLGWAGGEDMRYAESLEDLARRAREAEAVRMANEQRAQLAAEACRREAFREAFRKASRHRRVVAECDVQEGQP